MSCVQWETSCFQAWSGFLANSSRSCWFLNRPTSSDLPAPQDLQLGFRQPAPLSHSTLSLVYFSAKLVWLPVLLSYSCRPMVPTGPTVPQVSGRVLSFSRAHSLLASWAPSRAVSSSAHRRRWRYERGPCKREGRIFTPYANPCLPLRDFP